MKTISAPDRRIWAVLAVVFAYLLVLHFLRDNLYVEQAGLIFEYAALLPCLWWYLAGLRGSGGGAVAMPRVALVLGLAVLALCIPLARHEYTSNDNADEFCYEFQARIYETGHVVAEPLPGATADVRETPEEVNYQNHVLTTRGWYTHFPPGWPLLLVIGDWARAPWMLGPLLAAILLALTYETAAQIFSRSTAQLSVTMMALSLYFLVNGVRALSHGWSAVLAAGACLLTLRGIEEKRLAPLAWAFALLVMDLHVRPYTAAAQALVLGGAALWAMRENRRLFRRVIWMGAGFAGLGAATTMLYYYLATGHPLQSPYAARVGADVPRELTLNPRLIFYFFHKFGPLTLEETLFAAFPFLFLLAIYALWKERERALEVWMLGGLFAVVVVAYLFHTEKSYSYYGSRFHFEGFFAVAVLGARGVELLARHWKLPSRAVLGVLLLLSVIQISKAKGMAESVLKLGRPFHEIAVAAASPGVPLVFLASSPGYNARFMNLNQADWRHAPVVYLIDSDPKKRDEWACRFGRPQWIVLGLDERGTAQVKRGESSCGGK